MAERATSREPHTEWHRGGAPQPGTPWRGDDRHRSHHAPGIRRDRDRLGARTTRECLRSARLARPTELANALHRQQELRRATRSTRGLDKDGDRTIAALPRLPVHAGERCALPPHRAHIAGAQERLRHPRHQHQTARVGCERERFLHDDCQGCAQGELSQAVPERAIVLDRDRRRSRQRRGPDQRRGNDRGWARAVLDRAIPLHRRQAAYLERREDVGGRKSGSAAIATGELEHQGSGSHHHRVRRGCIGFVRPLRALPHHEQLEEVQEAEAISRPQTFPGKSALAVPESSRRCRACGHDLARGFYGACHRQQVRAVAKLAERFWRGDIQ